MLLIRLDSRCCYLNCSCRDKIFILLSQRVAIYDQSAHGFRCSYSQGCYLNWFSLIENSILSSWAWPPILFLLFLFRPALFLYFFPQNFSRELLQWSIYLSSSHSSLRWPSYCYLILRYHLCFSYSCAFMSCLALIYLNCYFQVTYSFSFFLTHLRQDQEPLGLLRVEIHHFHLLHHRSKHLISSRCLAMNCHS